MVSQQQFDDVTAELVNKEQFEQLRVRLVAYESQQAIGQTEMQQKVKSQVSEVTEGLKALYTVADLAIGAVASRVQRIEEELIAQGGNRGGMRREEEKIGDLRVCYISRT